MSKKENRSVVEVFQEIPWGCQAVLGLGAVMIWVCHSLQGIPTLDGLKAALTPPTVPLPHELHITASTLTAVSLTYRARLTHFNST